MKKAVLFTLVLLFILPAGYGQQKKGPVRSDVWRRFVPPDKSFSILVPTAPTNVPDEISFRDIMVKGLAERWAFARNNELYLIFYRDYIAPPDETDRKEKYASMSWPRSPAIEVFAGHYSGIELSDDISGAWFKGIPYRSICRVFIVDQRLFVLQAFVPWDPHLPVKNRRSKANTDRFFNSFKLPDGTPQLRYFESRAEPKLDGRLEGQTFRSNLLDLIIQSPIGWKTKICHPAVSDGTTADPAAERDEILAGLGPDGVALFRVSVKKPEFANSSVSEFARARTALVAEKPPSRQIINGREFWMNEFDLNPAEFDPSSADNDPLTFRKYYTEWNGYFLEIAMYYKKEADKEVMEASLKTLSRLSGN